MGNLFLVIGKISILSFAVLSERNYKMLLLGIITILAGISELVFFNSNEIKENERYAGKAAVFTVITVFFFSIAMVLLCYFTPDLLPELSLLNVFEITTGIVGICYLGSYFIRKIKGEKKHN